MLPTKLSRAAQRATASPPNSTCYACLAKQRTHQRRHSSSKASSSRAEGYSNKSAGPATKAGTPSPSAAEGEQAPASSTATATATQETRTPTRTSKGRTRLPRRSSSGHDGAKKVAPAAEQEEKFTKLPSVPSVQSLSESERSISNFFSLHRPMSITHTFPPTSSTETFNRIFTTTPAPEDPWANGNSAERRPEDVIYTLNSTIENLENRAAAEGQAEGEAEGVRWEIIQEGGEGRGNVVNLDGQPRGAGMKMNLEELVAQFKPFRAPPPPVPFPEYETAKSKQKERKAVQQAPDAAKQGQVKPKQKTFTTTITVTESEWANGRKTYTASSGPIVSQAVQENDTASTALTVEARPRLTRRERVRKMQQDAAAAMASASSQDVDAQVPGTSVNGVISTVRRAPLGERERRMGRTMFLISVKRQRKLKMKKHKYKKLMKRTRNLRRRLERN